MSGGGWMRVISGSARGRAIRAPKSRKTRPMADKIKEASFSMLWSLGIEPSRVLDLYAGSGSIGIEAISRGAEWVDFVEHNSAACDVIRGNLDSVDFSAQGKVHQVTVDTFLKRDPDAYDLIVMDPPYADPEIVPTMERLAASTAVTSGTVLLIGHSPRVTLPEAAGCLMQIRQRCHGDSCFSIYECTE